MSIIIDTVLDYLPRKRKKTPSGWISFNCVACSHNGTSMDTRQRAGVIITEEGISYSCFNCGFKTSWQYGQPINKKFKSLLSWLDIPNDVLIQCIKESLSSNIINIKSAEYLRPTFSIRKLPLGSRPIKEWIAQPYPDELNNVLQYIQNRNLFIDDYDWYWSDHKNHKDRLIIPFTHHGNIVGYTSRSILPDCKQRYMSDQQIGYVFNLDKQHYDRKFAIVCEGPFDAISIDGIALLGSNISGGQSMLINQLRKEVILVPDRDSSGKKLVKEALELGWSVSFPDWDHDIKDINDAVKAHGRLSTLYNIIDSRMNSKCAIEAKSRWWFK